MPYSTQEQLESNVEIFENTYETAERPAIATARIAMADSVVETDCSRYVDFDLVPNITDDPATPGFINLLSQYKSAELLLVNLSSAIRKNTEMHDITYWQDQYNELKTKIAEGSIDLELSDGTSVSKSSGKFRNTAKKDVDPYMGQGRYGRYADNDTLKDLQEFDDGAF